LIQYVSNTTPRAGSSLSAYEHHGRQPRSLGTALLPPNAEHGAATLINIAELDIKLLAKSLRERNKRTPGPAAGLGAVRQVVVV
jgi:hypothetical protein